MTRKEQIRQASIKYTLKNKPMCIGGDAFAEMADELNRNPAFEEGAKWADKNPNPQNIAEYLYKEKGYPISLNGEIPTFEETMKDVQTYNDYKAKQWLEKQSEQESSQINEQKPTNKIEPKFKVGDWVVDNCGYVWKIEGILNQFYLLEGIEVDESRPTIDWVDNTFHLWTIQDAKDGDILAAHECLVIFKEIDGLNIKCYCTYHYLGLNPSFYRDTLQNKDAFLPATKEQRDALMKAMKDAGYVWDEKKKELRELIKPKFDPKTLKPFDKVLGRNCDGCRWSCKFYSYKLEAIDEHVTTGEIYKYCIPYNDDTKHLVGTTKEAPEFYRYWEG